MQAKKYDNKTTFMEYSFHLIYMLALLFISENMYSHQLLPISLPPSH